MRSFFAVALAASSSVCQGFAMKPIKTPGLAMPAVQLIADRCWDTFLWAADVQPLQLGKDIEIAPSRGRGDGLFAKRDLEKGEIVGRYAGVMRSVEDQDKLCAQGKATRDYVFEVPETNWVIDGEDPSKSSVVRYVNHSIRRANCEAGRLNLQGRAWGIYREPRTMKLRSLCSQHATDSSMHGSIHACWQWRSISRSRRARNYSSTTVRVPLLLSCCSLASFHMRVPLDEAHLTSVRAIPLALATWHIAGVVYWDGVYRRVDPRRWKADFL